jgi:dihydroorotase
VEASTLAPMSVIGLPTEGLLAPGARAEFTVFTRDPDELRIADSMGHEAVLRELLTPRWTVMGAGLVRASSYRAARAAAACGDCGENPAG